MTIKQSLSINKVLTKAKDYDIKNPFIEEYHIDILPKSGTLEFRGDKSWIEDGEFSHFRLYVNDYPDEYSIALNNLLRMFYEGERENAHFLRGKKGPYSEYAFIRANRYCHNLPPKSNYKIKDILEYFDGKRFDLVGQITILRLPYYTKWEDDINKLREALEPKEKLLLNFDIESYFNR